MAKSRGDNIIHSTAVRMLVTGSGNLQTRLISLKDVRSQTLTDTVLETDTDREPTRLSNFKSQKIQIEIRLRVINEYFEFNKFNIFIKPVSTGYPQ